MGGVLSLYLDVHIEGGSPQIVQTWTRGGRGSKIPKFVQTYLMEAPLTITISSSNNKITITVVIAFHFSGITLLITKPQSHIFETARSTEQPALPPYVRPYLPPTLPSTKAEFDDNNGDVNTAYLPSLTI